MVAGATSGISVVGVGSTATVEENIVLALRDRGFSIESGAAATLRDNHVIAANFGIVVTVAGSTATCPATRSSGTRVAGLVVEDGSGAEARGNRLLFPGETGVLVQGEGTDADVSESLVSGALLSGILVRNGANAIVGPGTRVSTAFWNTPPGQAPDDDDAQRQHQVPIPTCRYDDAAGDPSHRSPRFRRDRHRGRRNRRSRPGSQLKTRLILASTCSKDAGYHRQQPSERSHSDRHVGQHGRGRRALRRRVDRRCGARAHRPRPGDDGRGNRVLKLKTRTPSVWPCLKGPHSTQRTSRPKEGCTASSSLALAPRRLLPRAP